jgi:hypothetical protein
VFVTIPGPRTSAVAVVVTLLLAALQVPLSATGQEVNPQSELVVDTFEDMLEEREIAFPEPGFNDDTAIVLPNHAFVSQATVNMSFGTFPGTRSAPWDPSLDVGTDGIVDWAFDSDRGGPVGLQDRFSDGSIEKSFQFMGTGEREMFIQLPRDAEITEAYIDVEGFPIPHWVKQYTLTPRTDSKGEYGPKMAEYDGEMWVIWQSSDENITTGGDADVVVRMFDGEKWHRIIELSEYGDDDEDDIPQIIAYGGKLYAIWSRGDGRATAGGHSELVYREFDGTEWGPITRFSGTKEDGLNTYERCVVYDGRLYVFWKTTDPNVCNHATWLGRDLDIVYTSFDGDRWAPIVEITDSDNDYEDWSVDVTVFRGMLYVIWDSWDPTISGIVGNVDVAYRAFDGRRWTDTINLSPVSDRSIAFGETQDALPRFYVWHNPVTGEEELFAIWMRGRTILPPADGEGYHIVYRRYTGSDWTPMEQLSFAGDEPVDQMFPSLVGFNDTLYAIWTIGTNTTSRPEGTTTLIATYGDIIIRSFDGADWSPVLELTPLGNGYDNASHPSVYIYDNKLFAAWETPLPTPQGGHSWEIVMRHLEVAPVTIRFEIGDEEDPVEWGWERIGNTKRRIHFDPEDLTACLNNAPYTQDRFGTRYTELPLRLGDMSAASIRLSNLTIRYDFRVEVDFAGTAEAVVSEARDNTHVDKDVRIVFELSTGQAGTITLEDPNVVYKLDYPPMLVGPVPDQELFEDEARDYLVNLAEYFTDDWDAEDLRFAIIEESDPDLVDLYLRGTWLSVKLPEKDWNGEVAVRVRAFDRHPFYHNDSNEIVITVLPVNDAPILDYIPDEELEVDVDHVRYLTARDPDVEDRGKLVFSTDSDVVTVGPKGRLEVTFRSFHPRIIHFNVTVTDPAGANDSQEVKYNYTPTRVFIETKDDFPYVLFLLLLLILALVVAERLRRPYRMTEEEKLWDEEAAWEEVERARTSGKWYRRWF